MEALLNIFLIGLAIFVAGLMGTPLYAIMIKLTYDFVNSQIDLFKRERGGDGSAD